MAATKEAPEPQRRRRPRATTPEGREKQLIGMAFDLAEKQLSDGTASAQVVTHLMKLGGRRNSLEEEKLMQENSLLKAKIAAIESGARIEELYEGAIKAMRQYSGQEVIEELED